MSTHAHNDGMSSGRPFVTVWMGENHFAAETVALYGVVPDRRIQKVLVT